jgi:streptogramin lyase
LDTDAGRPPASRADRPALARRLAPLRRLPDRLDRRSTILVVAAASALAVAVVVLRLGGGGGAAAPAVTRLAVGGRPAALAAAGGSIWVANQRDATLTRIDPTRAKVTVRAKRTVSLPARLAAGDTGLWVASTTGAVSRLNPQTGEPIAAERTLRTEIYDVVAAAGALWVANGTAGTVERYAVAGARLSAPVEVHVGKGTSALAAGADSVWAVSPDSGTLTRLDPASGQPRAQLGVGLGADDVAVSGRAVWVSNPDRGTLTRVDARTGKVTRTVRVPRATDGALAAGRGAVYFLNSDTGAVTRVDATSGRIRGDPLVAASPGATDALAAKGALWITDSNRDAVERVTY